ncbi:MAG: trypsin-like peptidase domain-containing protein [Bacteroidota bacterium]
MTQDNRMLDSIERYIKGEMLPDERVYFEQLRKTNAEVDQLVVEQTLFFQQMNRFGEWKKFKSGLEDIHIELAQQGGINSNKLKGGARVVYLWNRYKRVAAIAASIAGVVAIGLSTLVNSITPHKETAKVQELVQDVALLKSVAHNLNAKIDNVDKKKADNAITIIPKYNGTGFLIDGKGFLITNAHVVKNSKNIFVQNNKGDQFKAFVVKLDVTRDLAILKIDDDSFKNNYTLPYGFRKATTDIAESIFTLGYPRDEIVYSEGYLSAKTGFNGDTLSCQIGIAANPGNSGGPVFDRNGEVIGILSTKEMQAEGVVFAIQSKYILQAIDELKKDSLYHNIKVPLTSGLHGMDKVQQAKKVQDYVFMVKGD